MIEQKIVISFFFLCYKISRIHFINDPLRILFLFDQLGKIISINPVFPTYAHVMSAAACNFFHCVRINICHSMGSSQNNIIKLLCYNCMYIVSHKSTGIECCIQQYKKGNADHQHQERF